MHHYAPAAGAFGLGLSGFGQLRKRPRGRMPLMSGTPLGEQLPPATAWPPGWRFAEETSEPRRPGTVLAAAIVTWSAAGLTLVGSASALVFVLWLGAPIFDAFDGSRTAALVLIAVTVVWSLAACLLAWWALAGRNWAR